MARPSRLFIQVDNQLFLTVRDHRILVLSSSSRVYRILRTTSELGITIQYNTIYYARRLVLAERALITNADVHCLIFVLVSPSPCCATHCPNCDRSSLSPYYTISCIVRIVTRLPKPILRQFLDCAFLSAPLRSAFSPWFSSVELADTHTHTQVYYAR
jgi:hypothetical protein